MADLGFAQADGLDNVCLIEDDSLPKLFLELAFFLLVLDDLEGGELMLADCGLQLSD